MITIIHGDDISQSRKYFIDLKIKQKNAITFDGGKITLTDLAQNIEGSSLFGDTKSIFIEELLSKNKKTDKTVKEIINFIAKNSDNASFVLWESKEITKRELFTFKNSVAKIFKLPKNIFLFMDSLRHNNSKNLLNLFHQAIDSGIKEELILFMMQRQIRFLLALSESGENEQIEEINRLAPWQMSKLISQAKLFDKEKLKIIYKKLFEIELGQKTGNLFSTLSQAIDFLLLEM
jgi:DNA polymerase III delta subunit